MQYLLYILSIPFIYFNYKIIISDIKNKIIPNKYLGYLLLLIPFYYIYIILTFPDINYIYFIFQIILTFLVSFMLYYFGIWAAGDAKYIIILTLFIPYIGIVPFMGNIALLTIFYLLLYFLYFYLGKIIFFKKYRKSLVTNIKIDLNEKWQIYKKNKGGKTIFIILKFILVFLIIFITIRLIRIYFLKDFLNLFSNSNNNGGGIFSFIINSFQEYSTYIVLLGIIFFITIIWLLKWLYNQLKKYILIKIKKGLFKKNIISEKKIDIIFLVIIIFSLSIFIRYEYINNPSQIKNSLFLIFTYYISLYLIFKILKYSYKITFGVAEINYIDINKLKKGDIVDKEYLIKIFGNQVFLGADGINQNKKGILYPSPKKYFTEIDKVLNKKNLKIIKKCYQETNNYHSKLNKNFQPNNTIKIINTFSFGPYIFTGFIITFFYQNLLFQYILNFLIEIFKNITQK